MRRIQANKIIDLKFALVDRKLVSATVTSSLEPVLLSLAKEPDYRNENFPKNYSTTNNQFRIHHLKEGELKTFDLPKTKENFHFVQSLGRNLWLMVRSRAESPSDINAHVFTENGHKVNSFHLGDGIEDVQTTEDGQKIWVSYFDEGVFGNYEFLTQHGFGQAGLACFSMSGEIIFDFNEVTKSGEIPFIDDCYALNVASDSEVWIYYSSDFPLIKIQHNKVDAIISDLPVTGAHCFAVHEGKALFNGGYSNKRGLFLVSLLTKEAEEVVPVDFNDHNISFNKAFGRGSNFYLVNEEGLYVISLLNT